MVATQVKKGTRKSPSSFYRFGKLYVDANEAREHIKKLQQQHSMTKNGISRAAKVANDTVDRLVDGRSQVILSTTSQRILSVVSSDKSKYGLPHTIIKSEKSVALMDEMHEAGFGYTWLMKQCGWQRTFWDCKYRGRLMTIKIALRVRALHNELWAENAEGWQRQGYRTGSKKVYSGKTMRQVCQCHDELNRFDKRILAKATKFH